MLLSSAILAAAATTAAADTRPASAARGSDPIGDLKTLYEAVDFSSDLTALNTYLDPVQDPTNPGNLIKDIETNLFRVESRNIVSYRDRDLGLLLRVEPWLMFERTDYGAGQTESRHTQDVKLFVNGYTAKLQGAVPNTTLAATRSVIQWAPGFFASPSNPFRVRLSTENPVFVERGSDFLWASYSPTWKLSFSYFFNYNAGAFEQEETVRDQFLRTHLGRVTYTANEFTLSAVGGHQKERGAFVGSYGQWTVDEASLLYYDAAMFWKSQGYYPVSAPSLSTDGFYEQNEINSGGVFPQILIGTSYTTLQNYTFYAEYFYYGPGYDNDELKLSHQINSAASSVFYTDTSLASSVLGAGASNSLLFIGKHFLNLQMVKRWDSLEWVVQNANSLQDGTGRLFSSLSYAWSKNEIAASAIVFYGEPGGVLRQDVSFLATIGLQRRF